MRSQFNISHLKKRTSRPFLWLSVHIKADLHGRTGGVIHLPLNRISEWQDQCQSTFNSIISKSKQARLPNNLFSSFKFTGSVCVISCFSCYFPHDGENISE